MSAPSKLAARIDARLAAYATLAGAALAAPAQVNANIIWSGTVNINIPSTVSGVYINLVTGVFGTTPGAVPGWDINPWGNTSLNIWANDSASPLSGVITDFTGGSSATLVDNLPPGTPIVDSWTYGRTAAVETTGATAFNINSSGNLIGFRFLNELTGQYNYGWAQLALSSSFSSQPRTFVQYAYDNSGAFIALGLIPEPSTTALLALVATGALGLRAWRKRRQQSSL
jgi:hypothetical protein